MNLLLKIFGPTKDNSAKDRWLKYLARTLLILGVPILLYLLIRYDPVVGYDEYGDPERYGGLVFFILYWLLLLFAYKNAKHYSYLRKLLTKITTRKGLRQIQKTVENMSDDDDEDNVFYDGDMDIWLDRFKIK